MLPIPLFYSFHTCARLRERANSVKQDLRCLVPYILNVPLIAELLVLVHKIDEFLFKAQNADMSVPITTSLKTLWKSFGGLRRRYQIGIIALLIALLFGGIALARSGSKTSSATNDVPTVMVMRVSELAGNSNSVSIIGTVQSVSEANILAQIGGIVRSINTRIGASVPAGFIIASLDNASEQASVLQAQGAYDAAVAGRNITSLQSGNAQGSFAEAANSARGTYRSTFTSVDAALTNNADTLFGANTPIGPATLFSSPDHDSFSRRRQALKDTMTTWRSDVANADTTDPTTLLAEADSISQSVALFLSDLSVAANYYGSNATPTQLTSLTAARATVDGVRASISLARDNYNTKKTAAQVGSQQSVSSGSSTASADASVKQALGGLRGAQAALEKTLIRAPISGSVNFLAPHVGDYIGPLTHVATVAQNGALEIKAFISEDNRNFLSIGQNVSVDTTLKGIITSIAPALDPVTKQIEVHVAVNGSPALVNGQSVHISFPNLLPATTAKSTQTLYLPLAAVKLLTNSRVVYSVGTDGRLVAHPVEIGDVLGDRIAIKTSLSADLVIVADARGLSEGEKVNVATDTPK
jgi:RND family efflux transporter MFP subunit